MNLLLLLVPAATALFLILPLIRPAEDGEGIERGEEARRMEAEILAEIDDDREGGLADGEDREEFLRRTGGDLDE